MIGPFKPSPSLSGGLLWKIPWRLSAPQKLRQRRRLRHVDNVVSVLSSALTRQSQTATSSATPSTLTPASANQTNKITTTTTNYSSTNPNPNATSPSSRSPSTTLPAERRHGKGPKQGDYLPDRTTGTTSTLLSDEARRQGTTRLIERWRAEMPQETEMRPRDKYTMFDRKARGYRKGVHKLPKWTRVSQRLNPPGF